MYDLQWPKFRENRSTGSKVEMGTDRHTQSSSIKEGQRDQEIVAYD